MDFNELCVSIKYKRCTQFSVHFGNPFFELGFRKYVKMVRCMLIPKKTLPPLNGCYSKDCSHIKQEQYKQVGTRKDLWKASRALDSISEEFVPRRGSILGKGEFIYLSQKINRDRSLVNCFVFSEEIPCESIVGIWRST